MPLPFLHRPAKLASTPGSDCAEFFVSRIAASLVSLSTADKNRALLALAAWIAAQLEALEANNDTWPE